MPRPLIFFALCLFVTPPVLAEPLSLAAAVERALQSNPGLVVERARIGQVEAERFAAARILPFNPELQGDGARNVTSSDGPVDYRFGAALSQQLEVAGQRGLRIDRADAALASAHARLLALERTVARDAADAYYALWLAREERELQTKILKIAERLDQAAGLRLRAGDIAELDAGLATLEVARARAALEIAIARQRAAELELGVAMGMPATFRPQPTDDPPADVVPLSESDATLPALDAASHDLRAAEVEVALRRRERLPNPTLAIGFEHERLGLHGHLPDGQHATFTHASNMVGASIVIPLPLWDRGQGEVRAAYAGRETAQADLLRVGLELDAERRVAEAVAEGEARALAQRRSTLPVVERNLALMEQAFAAGQIGMVELLAARERAFAARREHLQSRAQYGRALNALARARGALPPGASR